MRIYSWIYLSEDPMLQSLMIISACIFGVQTSDVNDENYTLSTTESPVLITSLQDARNKCVDSWLLEIYDENVVALLQKLNVSTQQNKILLGMTTDSNGWRWSDGTEFLGTVEDQTADTYVVACSSNKNGNNITYSAKKLDEYAAVICSKVVTKDDCSGWFYNRLCYFKINSSYYKWFEAHNECIKNGASMAMFKNSETNFNTSFIDNQFYWVSLSRTTWKWAHADEAVSFNKWATGQPVTNDKKCATTNSNGNEWTSVDCSGTYHIVCMRENQKLSTIQSALTTLGINNNNNNNNNVITPTSKNPAIANSLSIAAKEGIIVGVCLLLVIITIVGALVFKYFHHCKKSLQRKTSIAPTSPENEFDVIGNNNGQTISPEITSPQLENADLDFKKRFEENIKSADD